MNDDRFAVAKQAEASASEREVGICVDDLWFDGCCFFLGRCRVVCFFFLRNLFRTIDSRADVGSHLTQQGPCDLASLDLNLPHR